MDQCKHKSVWIRQHIQKPCVNGCISDSFGLALEKMCMFSSSKCAFPLNNKLLRYSTLWLLPEHRPLFLISWALQHLVASVRAAHHKLFSFTSCHPHESTSDFQLKQTQLKFCLAQFRVCLLWQYLFSSSENLYIIRRISHLMNLFWSRARMCLPTICGNIVSVPHGPQSHI